MAIVGTVAAANREMQPCEEWQRTSAGNKTTRYAFPPNYCILAAHDYAHSFSNHTIPQTLMTELVNSPKVEYHERDTSR